MKIKDKITISFTVLTGITILLLSLFIYFFSLQHTRQNFYLRLQERALIAGQAFLERDEVSASIYNHIREEHLRVLPDEEEYFIRVNQQTGRMLSDTTLFLPDSFYEQVMQSHYATQQIGNTFYVGIFYSDNQGDYIVVVSASDVNGAHKMQNLLRLLIIGFIISILFTYLLGRFFSRQLVQPLTHINREVRNIRASNLHLRLKPDQNTEEVAELAHSFNDMLDRLETSFETQRNFISNASHELRTPLTTISGEAELALLKEREPAEYTRSLQVISREAWRLNEIVSSLLNLAQSGYDGTRQPTEPIRLDELLIGVKEDLTITIPQNQICLDFSALPEDPDKLSMEGNSNLLRLALMNIVQNACKYSDNAPVIIRLRPDGEEVEVEIEDQGIGIPSKDLAHIYEPFYRASNAMGFTGTGVGLSLAEKIIRMHRGTIAIESEERSGTLIRLRLPLR